MVRARTRARMEARSRGLRKGGGGRIGHGGGGGGRLQNAAVGASEAEAAVILALELPAVIVHPVMVGGSIPAGPTGFSSQQAEGL